MREVTIKVYRFDELPEETQRRIFERDQNREIFEDGYSSEYLATLEKFADFFDIEIKYEVNSIRYNFDFTITDNETAENLETIRDPLRLATWVYNNHWWELRRGKYYSTPGKWIDGKHTYKKRYSRVIFTYDDLPLTGVVTDHFILNTIIDCITYRRTFETYDDLITTALNEFFEAWREELEYLESFECFAETVTTDGIEYTADGVRW